MSAFGTPPYAPARLLVSGRRDRIQGPVGRISDRGISLGYDDDCEVAQALIRDTCSSVSPTGGSGCEQDLDEILSASGRSPCHAASGALLVSQHRRPPAPPGRPSRTDESSSYAQIDARLRSGTSRMRGQRGSHSTATLSSPGDR